MAGRKRLESIQILRAFAFIAIFLSHVNIVSSGVFGVSVFLVLSGFCMVYAYLPDGQYENVGIIANMKFAIGRIKKLYPLHILVMVGYLILDGFKDNNPILSVFYLIMNAGLMQSLIPWADGYFSFNAVSWYLSTSLICYFLFPWVLKRLRTANRRTAVRILMEAVITQNLASALLWTGHNFAGLGNDFIKWVTYICPFYRMGDVISGAALGWFFLNRKSKSVERKIVYIAVFLLSGIVALQLFGYTNTAIPRAFVFDLYWLPVCMGLVWIFAICENVLGGGKSDWVKRALIHVGDISGYAFLIHKIIIRGVSSFVSDKAVIAVTAFAVTVGCAEVFRFFYVRSYAR